MVVGPGQRFEYGFIDEAGMRVEVAPTGSHGHPVRVLNDNPMSESITIEDNIKIEPKPGLFGVFKITSGDNSYTVDACNTYHMHQEILTCLAKHAVRLKKNIAFIQRFDGSELEEGIIAEPNTIRIYAYHSELLRYSTSRRIDLGNRFSIDLNAVEIKMNRSMRIFQQPTPEQGMGIVIKDRKNLPIAYMSTNYGVICLLWNGLSVLETPHTAVTKYIDYILCNYTKDFDKIQAEAQKKLEQKRAEKRKREYINFLENMFQNSLRQIDRRIQELQRDADAHIRGLNSKSKDIAKEHGFINDIKNKRGSEKFKTQLENDYKLLENMRKASKYTQYRFEGDALVGFTPIIKLFGKYDIGKFEIRLYLDGRIKCNNLNGRVHDNQIDHPHVAHGDPCWGNLDQSVIKLMRESQFGVVFDLMSEFLNHYNDGKGSGAHAKPYISLEDGWPHFVQQGILKKCEHCNRIKELCKCGNVENRQTCRYCEESLEDCLCRRCPNTERCLHPNNIVDDDDGDGGDVACEEGCEYHKEGQCNY